MRAKFGVGSLTYNGHGYASSKPGYTPAHAIDFGPIGDWGKMASGADRKLGDEIVAFLMRNWETFGLMNVIWYEQINTNGSPSGWKWYDWRPYYNSGLGSRDVDTHKHGDHAHVQLRNTGLIGEYADGA